MGDKRKLKDEKQRLLDEMAKCDPESERYSKLAAQLAKLTEAEKNQNGWRAQFGCGAVQTAINAIFSSINVLGVLRHEDKGNVVTTKSLNYAPKPGK